MLDVQVVDNFVREYCSFVTTSKGGTHWLARCPLCGDSKKNSRKRRFNLDWSKGSPVYQCFNCGRSGSFVSFYMEMKGIEYEDARRELFGYNPDGLKSKLKRKPMRKEAKKNNVENFNWIRDDCISRYQRTEGIIERKYSEVLQKFCDERRIPEDREILVAIRGDYKSRIIIPVVDTNNNIIYFQARRLAGSNIEPKYKNPHVEKDSVILNKHKFKRDKHIIITEGIIDAFMIGDQGTTCLGAYMSEQFIGRVLKYTDQSVIVAFDNDDTGKLELRRFILGVEQNGKRKKKKRRPANKYAKKVKYFIFPKEYQRCKDINNIRTDFGITNIYDMIVKNSLTYTGAAVNILMKEKL